MTVAHVSASRESYDAAGDSNLERSVGEKELLVCPYCKSNKRKGLVEVALRTRLPGGTGSEIAAWAADFAASGGFSVDEVGGEPPLWAESETVVAGDMVGGAERAGGKFFVQKAVHAPLQLCMNCPRA